MQKLHGRRHLERLQLERGKRDAEVGALAFAHGKQECERLGREAPRGERQRFGRRAVEPVCVVDDDEQRDSLGRHAEEAERARVDGEPIHRSRLPRARARREGRAPAAPESRGDGRPAARAAPASPRTGAPPRIRPPCSAAPGSRSPAARRNREAASCRSRRCRGGQERGSGRGAPPLAAHPAARARDRARSAWPNASRRATTRGRSREIPDAPKRAGAARSSTMQETPLQPIVYSLQFRGRITSLSSRVLEQRASAPSQVLITTVDANGLAGDVQPGEGKEALLVSRLVLADDGSFDQSGTIEFAPGHVLAFRSVGAARLAPSPNPNLRHGAAIWEVEGGEGQFHGARGRITSNFFMSDTNELTDNHFGLIFVARASGSPRSRSKNPRSPSTLGHPRDVGRVPSLERVQGSPCGMRPLDGAMDRFPALPGRRVRGRIRPLRGGVERRPVRRQTQTARRRCLPRSALGLSLAKGSDMHPAKRSTRWSIDERREQ